MFDVLHKLSAIFPSHERKKLYWLTLAISFSSLIDTLGVASIFPFLKVVSEPGIIHTNRQLKWLYETMEFQNETRFIVALGIAVFIVLVSANICRSVISALQTRMVWMEHYRISKRLFSQYLYEPYVFFLNRNSAELTTHLMAEIGRVIGHVLLPFMNFIAKFVFVISVFVLLLTVDLTATLIGSAIFGIGYALVYFVCKCKLFRIGQDLKHHANVMYKVLNEAFGSIKDIKVLGKEDAFIDRFSQPARKIVDSYCAEFIMTNLPRYAFESIAVGGLLIVTIYSVVINRNYQQAVPLIGLYALAAYRLMPAFQQMFQSLSSMRFGQSALESVYEGTLHYKDYTVRKELVNGARLNLFQGIELSNMTFQYPKTERSVFQNFDLFIKVNTTIGFVGGTGAGKTTLIDILLGLLRPQYGKMLVDGVEITDDNLRMWQRNIGYVPQHIYLIDTTITRNIAFGIPDSEIDQEAVERAARLANIHNFIKEKLPQGYNTEVGERGIRLSGGERQRIGIARALYRDPSLLVFDEATSALDGITEDAILEAIHDLAHKKTIIIIAHRLTSIKDCDVVYLLDEGKIAAKGTYHELLAHNQQFQRMAKNLTGDHKFSYSQGVRDKF